MIKRLLVLFWFLFAIQSFASDRDVDYAQNDLTEDTTANTRTCQHKGANCPSDVIYFIQVCNDDAESDAMCVDFSGTAATTACNSGTGHKILKDECFEGYYEVISISTIGTGPISAFRYSFKGRIQ